MRVSVLVLLKDRMGEAGEKRMALIQHLPLNRAGPMQHKEQLKSQGLRLPDTVIYLTTTDSGFPNSQGQLFLLAQPPPHPAWFQELWDNRQKNHVLLGKAFARRNFLFVRINLFLGEDAMGEGCSKRSRGRGGCPQENCSPPAWLLPAQPWDWPSNEPGRREGLPVSLFNS